MDLALKQRLVGATVLMAAAVVFIPMILDGSSQSARGNLPQIPDRPDVHFETRRLPLDTEAQVEAEPATRPTTSPSSIPEVVVGAVNQAAPQALVPDPLPEPVDDASSDETAGSRDATDPPVARADEADEDSTMVEPVAQSPFQSAPSGQSVPSGAWTIQLGTFSREDNAASLVLEVQALDLGFTAYSDAVPVDGETMYRVRAGAFADRETAVDAGTRLAEELKVEASLRRVRGGELQEDAPSVVGYMVQVGSFASENNAAGLRDRLREAGFSAHMDRIASENGPRYRVRVGPQIEREDANAVRARLIDEMGLSGMVVSHP